MPVKVALAVQYATPVSELPRWRLRRWVRHAVDMAAAEPGRDTELDAVAFTVRLVDGDEGRRLNHEFRQRDYATNVLTFEYGVDADGVAMGDIVLCVPVLRREAREQHKMLLDHAAHLVVHGALHALGYDHIEAAEAQEMEALETRILKKMGIADPYQT